MHKSPIDKSGTQTEEPFLNLAEAADYLELHPHDVLDIISKGQLSSSRKGGILQFALSTLRNWKSSFGIDYVPFTSKKEVVYG